MVLIQDRILKIDIYNFEMSYKTPEKSLKSNQIYSEHTHICLCKIAEFWCGASSSTNKYQHTISCAALCGLKVT